MNAATNRHPTTRSWSLPPDDRVPLGAGLSRTNLRALAAREGRLEHHLMVVARIGAVQLEHATATEPLYFSHVNVSDEYALLLSTGDPRLDAAPFRVFFSDPETGADVGRIAHRVGDLVLHPSGLAHWPGRLRAPLAPPELPGPRAAVHSVVMCASRPTPAVDRPLFVSPGRDGDVRAYVEPAPPFLLAALGRDAQPGVVARVGAATLSVARPPFAPARGGYVLVLEAGEGAGSFDGDLVYVAPGARFSGEGVSRALSFESSSIDADPPPPSWEAVPAPPFAPFEGAPPGALPFRIGDLEAREIYALEVEISISGARARIPRYWLARTLFRLAMQGFALGRVETYGGLFYDDRDADRVVLGLRGTDAVATFDRAHIGPAIEGLYRAVAPPDYAEDLR